GATISQHEPFLPPVRYESSTAFAAPSSVGQRCSLALAGSADVQPLPAGSHHGRLGAAIRRRPGARVARAFAGATGRARADRARRVGPAFLAYQMRRPV